MSDLLQNSVSIQAQTRPDAVALVMEGRALTYGQLEKVTNRLARLLKAGGCQKGDRVCFAIPKSPEAIVAILSILKADCIHVPLDTASPAPRIAKLLRSSEPRCILGVGASAKLLEEVFSSNEFRDSISVGWLEPTALCRNFSPTFTSKDIDSYSSEPLPCQNTADEVAHLLFTSGSTGEPKGVAITHANVIHFVKWATHYFGMTESDRVSCHPPLHFDLATFDIFGAFTVGAQLHLVPSELNLLPNNMADFIRESELTQWFSVPSVLNYMAKFDVVKPNDFPSLKRILWCGEVFPTSALMYWMKRLPGVSFTNLYGPTEATIASSYYTVPTCPAESTQPIPIGTACDGEQLLVLDRDLQTVANGEVGDLYIGGVGLSPGYWRDPEKTGSAFLPYGDNDRIYRTGDLAKVGDDGLVYFVGRADTQIKSRGYRIELGEIEVVLNTFEQLKECAVVAVPTDGFENNLICCAYVIRDQVQLSTSEIRHRLSKVLPPYMLPSRFRSFKHLPKNANGKTDRRKIEEAFSLEDPTQQSDSDLRRLNNQTDVPEAAVAAPRARGTLAFKSEMNVVLAAEESAGLQLLRALTQRKDRVVAVLTTPPKPNSTRVSLWNAARDLGCETLPAELVRHPNLAERLRSENVDLFLNVHSLHVIHEEILTAPKLGAYNLHPGPLPRYAGLNAVSWAIFRGEQEHGVTVHRIDAKIDTGPIAYQACFPLEAEDTALSLSLKCVREGIALMLQLLDAAARNPGAIPSIPQDLSLRQYFGREVPEQGKVSWDWPAAKVVNFVRACDYFPFPSPWGHPRARLGVQEFALVKVHETGLACDVSPGTVGASSDSGVYVACRDQWIVASKLHLEGKYLPAREVLRSGDRLAENTNC